ncbi:MAG TPA: CBS domain-containing protein, partial [Actinomycetota bacterium]|nr:CBS domain-containing protein [Actinomycetota bacterium]
MTPRPVTVAPDANVRAALSALRRGRFRHLPVVAGEELVGVVTAADLEPPPGSPVEVAEALGARQVDEVMS